MAMPLVKSSAGGLFNFTPRIASELVLTKSPILLESALETDNYSHSKLLCQTAKTKLTNTFSYLLSYLELSKKFKIKHLIFASTSSVYGNSKRMPFKESDKNINPIQFYSSTKLSNEIMAYSYSSLFKIPITGMRIFTAYGPWGRPDMALFKFTKK